MTKLEEIARAIADAMNMEQNPHMYEPEDTLRAARAAVEALREPTDQMIMDGGTELPAFVIKDIWQSMLDAILSEKPDAD
jgi:hypothetical protein